MGSTMKKISLITLFCLSLQTTYSSSAIITLFIEKLMGSQTLSNGQEGITATYYGEKTISNNDGQISFPLKDTITNFYLLITPNQEPTFMLYNTVAGWTVNKNTPYSLYQMSLTHDTDLNLWYWNTEKAELANDRKVPLQTIVISAHPKEIVVPLGVTLTVKSPHAMLPTIYTQPSIDLAKNALLSVENNEFFGTLNTQRQITTQKDMPTVETKVSPLPQGI